MEKDILNKIIIEGKAYYHAGSCDIAVIGGGHAGCEAAHAAAVMGFNTILFSMNLDSIANMPCNPSIGGTAKGQLVREIDALGGLMGICADSNSIQFRMLNQSKGPAVLSPRAQIDRRRYGEEMKLLLEKTPGLQLRQDEICDIFRDNEGKLFALKTRFNTVYTFKRLIICTGTYLNAEIIIGEEVVKSGPDYHFPSTELSGALMKIGIKLQRFKTGTPDRVNLRSIDLSKLKMQEESEIKGCFSFLNEDDEKFLSRKQRPCYIAFTNSRTHKIIEENMERSPLFTGLIDGVGARYCPSIEDKVRRFSDKERHQLFIEPMSENGYEMYLQGLSSSLPQDVQDAFLRTIDGFENAVVQRQAYAIEYDCLEPSELSLSLQLKKHPEIFTAGQINGSSGYEEAAAQGIIAGINAALDLMGRPPLILKRSEAYIGVLIDDLTTKGTKEPYRMMTSRAEYRLVLRQDNADLRLTEIGRKIGLVDDRRWDAYKKRKAELDAEILRIQKLRVHPSENVNNFLVSMGTSPLKSGVSMAELIKRPQLSYTSLRALDPERPDLSSSVSYQVNVMLKYRGYIEMEEERIKKQSEMENTKIPEDFYSEEIRGLRNEAKEKLMLMRPETLGQASRISGISPADIQVLSIRLEQKRREKHGNGCA